MNKARLIVLGIVSMGALIGFLILAQKTGGFASPEAVFNRFISQDVPEELQADILIISGVKVERIVLNNLTNKEAPKRLYMMAYLAAIRSTNAVPVLKLIGNDPTEPTVVRRDAIRAVFSINKAEAIELANNLKLPSEELVETLPPILSGDPHWQLGNRSYADAFWGRKRKQ